MNKLIGFYSLSIILFFLNSWIPSSVFGAPNLLTYQGRILKNDNTPLEFNNVAFNFEITSPDGLCILYSEQLNGINMVNSNGVFNVAIGAGVKSFPAAPAFKVLDAFSNSGALGCFGGSTYLPLFDDIRKLRVQFHDGIGWQIISPDFDIRSVPFAGFAQSASKLGNYISSDFIIKTDIPTCTTSSFLSWNGSALSCQTPATPPSSINSLNGQLGTAQIFSAPGIAGLAPNWSSASNVHTLNIPMASMAAVTAGLISKSDYDNFSNKISSSANFAGDVSGTASAIVVDQIKGKAIVPIGYSAGQSLRYDGTNWVNAMLNLSTDITGILPVGSGGTGVASIGSGNLVVGAGSGAVTSLAGASAGNVVYATGASSWASGTPDTAGLVDKASTQTISGAKAFTNYIQMASTNEVRFADSDSSNYVGFKSPGTVAGNKIWVLPATDGTANQVLKTDGAGNLDWATPGGGGTVTSVATGTGLSGGPITGSGTISLANTAVTAAAYGSATQVGTFTVDAQGRLTAAANVTVTPAWGSITGTPTTIAGYGITDAASSTLADGKILVGNGSNVATPVTMSGDATIANTGALTLTANSVSGSEITNSSVDVSDLNFAGSMTTNTGLVVRDGTQFYNKVCAANQALVWSITNGWSCSSLVLAESDPKIGSHTTNYLSKWNGSTLVSSSIFENSGSIGIGSASPLEKIHIVGNEVTAGMNRASIRFEDTGIGASWNLVLNGSGSTDGSNKFSINQVGVGPRLLITSAGNVGIGTDSPNDKLQVIGGITAFADIIGGAGRVLTLGNDLNLFDIGVPNTISLRGVAAATEGGLQFGSGGATIYGKSGNIGIGTTSPAFNLDVTGNMRLNNGANGTIFNGGGMYFSGVPGAQTHANYIFRPGWGSGANTLATITVQNADTAGNYNDCVQLVSFGSSFITCGGLGIGTKTPGYQLHVVGTAGLSTGTAWTLASDIRLKDIHSDYEYGLNEILKLHTVRFSYKKDNALKIPSDTNLTGFIAQEVQKVIPDAVRTRKDGYLELNADPIHWASVNAIKELYGICKISQSQLDKIQDKVLIHDREIASLKSENQILKALLQQQNNELLKIKKKLGLE